MDRPKLFLNLLLVALVVVAVVAYWAGSKPAVSEARPSRARDAQTVSHAKATAPTTSAHHHKGCHGPAR